MTYSPPRISDFLPPELVQAAGMVIADTRAPEEFLLTYEAVAGDLGAGVDPRGPDDVIRYVAAAGYVHKLRGHRPRLSWRIGVSPDLNLAEPPDVHVDRATDAVAALVKELGGDDASLAALRTR